MKKALTSLKEFAAACALAVMLAGAPGDARAQCEVPGVTLATAGSIAGATVALLNANYLATQPIGAPGILPMAQNISVQVAQATLNTLLQLFERDLYARLRQFWDDYLQALKDMTAQLNGSLADQTRNLGNLFDTGGMTANQRTVQEIELKAKKEYLPTDEGCRFDTAGTAMGDGTGVANAMQKGMGTEFAGVGLNAAGSDAEKGSGQLVGRRMDRYKRLFCDADMNAGQAGCQTAGVSGPLANANVAVGKTLFGRETIPMYDTTPDGMGGTIGMGWKLATSELVYNLINYDSPEPIPQDALTSDAPQAKDRRAEQRAYATQMDAVGALVYDVVADRTPAKPRPGGAAPTDSSLQIQQLRQSNGITDAAPHPSLREIRQSVLEQLWNPNFYVNLHDSSSTAKRKEVFLEAFNLQLLYKMVDKTEKIANAFVAETANMLEEEQGDVTSDQQPNNPIRP